MNSYANFRVQVACLKYTLLYGQFCMNSLGEWTAELFASSVHSVLFIPHAAWVATSPAKDWVLSLTKWLKLSKCNHKWTIYDECSYLHVVCMQVLEFRLLFVPKPKSSHGAFFQESMPHNCCKYTLHHTFQSYRSFNGLFVSTWDQCPSSLNPINKIAFSFVP